MFMCVYMCTRRRPTKARRAPLHIALVALLLNLARALTAHVESWRRIVEGLRPLGESMKWSQPMNCRPANPVLGAPAL